MNGAVEHVGIVTEILPDGVLVRIEQQSACSMCRAKSLCTVSDTAEKFIKAELPVEMECAVGDRVTICGQKSLGVKAVLLAFVLPLCLLFAVLLVARIFTPNEAISGTIALCSLLPYYAVLSCFRKQMAAQFRFTIVKH